MLIHTEFSQLSATDGESTAVWLTEHGILDKIGKVDHVAVQLRDAPLYFTPKLTINVLRISSGGVLLSVGNSVSIGPKNLTRTVFCPMSNVVCIAAE